MSLHKDVLIIGAGLSGIGFARHLQMKSPQKSFAILDARDAIGGTWDLFRYPGVRSDSDMFTMGYNFKPWTDTQMLADGPKIRNYIMETAQEGGLDKHIRLGCKVLSAAWSSNTATWTLQVLNNATGTTQAMTCNFLMMCSGYYNYDEGFTPEFKGTEDFKGTIIHPQKWPENLDYKGKRVLVIGSGATAVTLVPAMAKDAEHVVMLQRSPTYVLAVPSRDKISERLRKYIPEKWVYHLGRIRRITMVSWFYKFSRAYPNFVRKILLSRVKAMVGPDFDMKHFTPKYNPWDERLCAVPSGDMFRTLKKGKASIVTDHIDKFTDAGILLKSGQTIKADIIVTATGLNLLAWGGIQVKVDGREMKVNEVMNYKGSMFSDIPNLAATFGYTNASWTLKADLIADYVCRLLNHMDARGDSICVPRQRDPSVKEEDFLDMRSGYIQRGKSEMSKLGSKVPWKLYQDYRQDIKLLGKSEVDDGVMEFSNPKVKFGNQAMGETELRQVA